MEKNMEKYLRAVRRRLNMPKALKDRVMMDFASSIEARIEDGQSEESILTEFGNPKQAAAELNTQMLEYTYEKSPWRWVSLALAVFSGLCLVYHGYANLLLMLFNKANNAASVGIIGGADGPTAVFVTTKQLYSGLPAEAIYAMLLIMGVLGFIALSKLKRK